MRHIFKSSHLVRTISERITGGGIQIIMRERIRTESPNNERNQPTNYHHDMGGNKLINT